MRKQIKKLFQKLFPCHFNEPLCKDNFFGCRCGKGETTIEAAPTTPAPSASETAADVYKAKLQYDPQMAALEMQTQQQYVPQQAALYQSMYNQYLPQLSQTQQRTQQQLYPQQSQILEAGAGGVLQNLQSPYQQQLSQGLTQQMLSQLQQPQTALSQAMAQQAMAGMQPSAMTGLSELEAIRGLQPNALLGTAEEQARAGIAPSALQQQMTQQAMAGLTPTGLSAEQQSAIDAIRQRQATGLSRQLRERSNLGGTLYGGRSQQLESQGLQELAQRYSAEDVDRLLAQRQAAMQQALGVGQFGLVQQQQGLAGLTGVAGMQEQARQQALQNLMGAAQLGPGLQQQALAGAGGVAGLQLQQRQQALQNAMAYQQQQQQAAIPYMQILYPQVGTQQPQVSPFQYQSAVPSADTLYNALFQASQPNYYASQGDTGAGAYGLGGALGGAAIMGTALVI